jgi:uncharacterized protein YbjT (DUF2867 family)
MAARPGSDAILIIGATGRTGRTMVADLLGRGYPVGALVRDPAAAREMLGSEVELINGDLREPAAVTGAFGRFGRIAFVAGSNGIEGRGTPREVEYDAVAAIVAALSPEVVGRFVLLSSAGVTQPEHPHNCTYHSVLSWKLRGEEALRQSGLPYTIVRALGLRDRAAGEQGVRIVQGDRIAFGEDIARDDLAAFLADVVAPNAGPRFAADFDTASLNDATCEVFNDSRIAGNVWVSSRARLEPDGAISQ